MLKNIWYCIKKTSEWYFALLVLYIIDPCKCYNPNSVCIFTEAGN